MAGKREDGVRERAIRAALVFSALFSVIAVLFIIVFLFKEGASIFGKAGLAEFVLGAHWNPAGSPPSFGALPLIVGTLLVTLGAMLFAVPFGVAGAVFISELAPGNLKSFLRFGVELLAGVPSVVYGLFGLVVLTDWLRVSFNVPTGESWLAGSLLLGIMALPTIISVAEDAIGAVPKSHREGSLALGATKWQTIWRVVLPCARSGVTAAIVLGMGRAIGETMAVLMVTGNAAVIPQPLTNVFSPIRTITGTLGIEMGEVAFGSMHYEALFGLAVLLFILVFVLNSLAMYVFKSRSGKKEGGTEGWLTKARARASRATVPLLLLLVAGGLFLANPPSVLLLLLIPAGGIISRSLPRKSAQTLAFGLITASFLAVMGALAIITFYIVSNGIGALSLPFLLEFPKNSGREGGIFPAIVGTVYLVVGAIAVALPIGACAAVYLAEYAREGWLKRIVRAGIDNLNGVPSIVFGLFGFAFFVLYLNLGISLLAGQLTLALMVLPTIIRTAEEAIKAVPPALREGSLALGATKWQTIWRVVLPPSIPGILTGVILGTGRAVGETAPIMFTAAVFSQRFLPSSELSPVMALPYHIYLLATSVPGASANASATALVLLALVFALYGATMLIRVKYSNRKNW